MSFIQCKSSTVMFLAVAVLLVLATSYAMAADLRLTLAQRINAAHATAVNTSPTSSCGAIDQNATGSNNGFYWEIGDQNGIITDPVSHLSAFGSVQPVNAPGTTYTRSTLMPIASSTKWLYATYILQKKAIKNFAGNWSIPAVYVPYLNFTSGYESMSDDSCPVSMTGTVKDCLNTLNGNKGNSVPNGTKTPADVGHFYYNGGHMEVLEAGADPTLAGLMNGGNNNVIDLTTEMKIPLLNKGIDAQLMFITPMTPGGIFTTSGDYAQVLQGMIRDKDPLIMGLMLKPTARDPYAVCTNPADPKCVDVNGNPLARYTPTPSNLIWHYGLGHWIEDDPNVGDGAYSSAGKFGFYPWVDATGKYYGIVARVDTNSSRHQGLRSQRCGAAIRKAFMTGTVQN